MRRRAALIENRKINLVLDVGANQGQFARSLREQCAYAGRIVSFEPLRDAFAALQQRAAQDPQWECLNIALGDADADAIINVSANSQILAVSGRSLEIEPSIAYVAKEQISVRRLDGLLKDISSREDLIYFKIDTQGYEMNVLNGALAALSQI